MAVEYTVTIATKHSVFSYSTAAISIQFVADDVATEVFPLQIDRNTVDQNGHAFQAGQTNVFKLKTRPMEDIQQLKLGFDNSGFVEGWKLDQVTVESKSAAKTCIFKHNGDLSKWKEGILTLDCHDETKKPRRFSSTTSDTSDVVNFIMGPILGIRSLTSAEKYKLCCLVATTSEVNVLPPLTFEYSIAEGKVLSHGTGEEVVLETVLDQRLWRYDWSVPRHQTLETTCTYYLPDGRKFKCVVPALNAAPRFALTSCADFSAPIVRPKSDPRRSIMWRHLRAEHEDTPLHLLIMAGDQVNADSIFTQAQSLAAWANLPKKERETGDFTDDMRKEAHEFYFQLYCERWREPEPGWIYARVPSLMMWNDHDILNGYGSMVSCPVIDGIYEVARKYFCLFQLRGLRKEKDWAKFRADCSTLWLRPETKKGDETIYTTLIYLVRLGDVAFLFLDGRSERTSSHILTISTLKEIAALLKQLENLKHLFVVAEIPFIFPDTALFPNMDSHLPWKKEWEYKYVQTWDASVSYDVERLKLFTLLSDFSLNKKTRVTILSGGVNVACWGKLHTDSGVVINMPTSSPLIDEPLSLISFVIGSCSSVEKDMEVPAHGKSWTGIVPIGTEQHAPCLLDDQNLMTFTPSKEQDELKYDTRVISRPNNLFSGNEAKLEAVVYTNTIRPFCVEEKTVPNKSGCMVM
ncbi:uncharacterized protein [Ptychodera flava]|uniref:uncharacterized protein n=1 Tax=Ptychodera flava TaxID=63121 RepID=UPI00396A6810